MKYRIETIYKRDTTYYMPEVLVGWWIFKYWEMIGSDGETNCFTNYCFSEELALERIEKYKLNRSQPKPTYKYL